MRMRLTSVVLIFLLAMLARDAMGWECHRRLLTGDEQRTLEAFVLKSTGLTADPHSIRACRNWDVVNVETMRTPQADGSERFAMLACYAMRKSWRDRWHCVGNPMTGFRADTYPGELGVWVAIDTPTALGLARRLVSLGFGVLARDDSIGYCGNAGGQARTLASLRKEITAGSGVVSLGRDQNRFWFEGGDAIVYFERDSDIASPKCWAEQEVVVTG